MPATIAAWFGLFVLVVGVVVAARELLRGGGMTRPLAIASAATLIGLPLIEVHRLEEVLLGDVGKITFAKEQAQADATEIATIKKRIEGQAATIDLVAQDAARARELSEEAQKAVDKATANLIVIEQDRRDQLEVGGLAGV